MSSDSPTERDLLQQILWRLGRIEERLNIDPPWKSRIGERKDGPPLPHDTNWPIEPAVPPGGRPQPRGTPPPLLNQPNQRPATERPPIYNPPEERPPRSTFNNPHGRLESIPEEETDPPEEPHRSDD
jgi:hypothetical protein